MNEKAVSRINRHIAEGGKVLSVVAGNGFERLSGKTCCTYLHDADGVVSAVLLETKPPDDSLEAAEFLCQQVVFAYTPSGRMQEMGIRGPKHKHLLIITYFDGLPPESQEYIRQKVLSLSKRSFFMGHISEWSDAAVEAMTK